jgi:cytochrome P450
VSGCVRGWAPCREALASAELVSDPRLAGREPFLANNLLFMDGEPHRRLRRLVAPYFTSHRLDDLGDRLDAGCRSLLESALADPAADLIGDLVEPLVLDAILTAMEVPEARRKKLSALARDMLELLEPDLPPAPRRRTTNAAVRATMLFERDRLSGGATGLHAALESAAEQGTIPAKLARSTPVVILHGGFENPLNQLGCVTAWAVENPERFEEAAASAPSLLFEEVLRVASPVRRVARWAARDGEWGETAPRRGDLAWVDLESANRDGGRFVTGDELDLSGRQQHLGFGHGAHACLGAALARLEGRVLIDALAEAPTGLLREFSVEWRGGAVAHGPARIRRRDRSGESGGEIAGSPA